MRHCAKTNCIYRAVPTSENGCDYITITGRSRIKDLPPDKQDPADCPYYVPGTTEGKPVIPACLKPATPVAAASYMPRTRQPYDWALCDKLEAQGLSRREVARALGCTESAVRHYHERKEKKK